MKRLSELLQEDNGRYSSMRLVLVGTFLLAVGFQIACIHWPHLQEQAIPFYSFASAVVGMKAFQKIKEEDSP